MGTPVARISARYYGGTYIARIVGQNRIASSTAGPRQAAELAVRRHLGESYEARLAAPGDPAEFEVFRKEVKPLGESAVRVKPCWIRAMARMTLSPTPTAGPAPSWRGRRSRK